MIHPHKDLLIYLATHGFDGEVIDQNGRAAEPKRNPTTDPDLRWCMKPSSAICTINNVEIPSPMKIMSGTDLYSADPTDPYFFRHHRNIDSGYQHMLCRRGLLHSSAPDAKTHAKALILAVGGEF